MVKEIDGTILEGGGQILRSSIALSAVLQEPVVVKRIRAKRKNPGLRPQHLQGILALQKLTDADVKGGHVGSGEITFSPKSRKGGEIVVNIGTAGAISLILQTLMLVTHFCSNLSLIRLSGGTNVAWSPPIDYLQHVLLPRLKQMGYSGKIEVERRGYYPKGGGSVQASLHPQNYLRAINLSRVETKSEIQGVSHCGSLPQHVAERQARAAVQTLKEAGYRCEKVAIEHNPHTLCPGSGISLWTTGDACRLAGSDALGRPGLKAEVVGRKAAQTLIKELESGAPVDKHQADMLVPYMALAQGTSSVFISELTQHTVTNVYVVEQFIETKFSVIGEVGKPAQIKVEGVAFEGFPVSP
ncbi:MAG: RNA 3'-terminal phosphate cyclase [Promethearchaeota archaeon]